MSERDDASADDNDTADSGFSSDDEIVSQSIISDGIMETSKRVANSATEAPTDSQKNEAASGPSTSEADKFDLKRIKIGKSTHSPSNSAKHSPKASPRSSRSSSPKISPR